MKFWKTEKGGVRVRLEEVIRKIREKMVDYEDTTEVVREMREKELCGSCGRKADDRRQEDV